MHSAKITVGSQTGGPECQRCWPQEKAFRDIVTDQRIHGFPPYVHELAILLRISGSLLRYEGEPVEEFTFDRKDKSISIDWLIAEHEWRDRSLAEMLRLFASRMVRSIDYIIDKCKLNYIDIDAAVLRQSMGIQVERIEHAASESE